jgi:hypothetical protein
MAIYFVVGQVVEVTNQTSAAIYVHEINHTESRILADGDRFIVGGSKGVYRILISLDGMEFLISRAFLRFDAGYFKIA